MERRTQFSWLFIPLLCGILLAAVPVGRLISFSLLPHKVGSEKFIYLIVRKGQSSVEISKALASQGIVSDGKLFAWIGRLTFQWKGVKAGEYKLSPSMSPFEIFSTITSGISAAHPLTIREGENMYEIAGDLQS